MLPYSSLIEAYNHRLSAGENQGSLYLDYDTACAVNLLWKRIVKNGGVSFPP